MTKQILNNGKEIPNIGYGSIIVSMNTKNYFTILKSVAKKILTFNFKSLRKEYMLYKIVKFAGRTSSKKILIDTSRAYGASEYIIGKAIKKNREKYYIVTKLCNKDQEKGNIKEALQESLKQLGIKKVDLYLMHWPVTGKYLNSWKQMEECYKEGLCDAIGVCNCNIHHLEDIKRIATVQRMVNQIECHPLFTQEKLREYCNTNNIKVMAYTATARMDERLKKTCLVKIAQKYNKTIPAIILRWHIQIKNIPIFNTSKLKNYENNMDIFDFELTQKEIEDISKININSRLRYDPDNCDFSQL